MATEIAQIGDEEEESFGPMLTSKLEVWISTIFFTLLLYSCLV